MTLLFGLVMSRYGFVIIDEMFHPEQILSHVEAMTEHQRNVHAWMTATLDVAYPFAYAALFIGIVFRFYDDPAVLLSLPSLLVIPIDLIEGFLQVQILLGDFRFVSIKAWVTPVKLLLFGTALAISVSGIAKGFLRWRAVSLASR